MFIILMVSHSQKCDENPGLDGCYTRCCSRNHSLISHLQDVESCVRFLFIHSLRKYNLLCLQANKLQSRRINAPTLRLPPRKWSIETEAECRKWSRKSEDFDFSFLFERKKKQQLFKSFDFFFNVKSYFGYARCYGWQYLFQLAGILFGK